jgi:hypothetical protein
LLVRFRIFFLLFFFLRHRPGWWRREILVLGRRNPRV